MENEENKQPWWTLGLNKSDWADAGRWMRHQFASWFSSSFVLVCMFALIISGIVIGMYYDGAYAVRWAPSDADKPWFRTYGWIISLSMVIFTSASVLAFRKGAWFSGLIAMIVGLYFLALSVTQSIGFVTVKAEEMTRDADAFDKAIDDQALTGAALIAELSRQRDALNDRVAARTETLSGEINQYITDGRNNDELADDSRDLRTEEQRRQDAELSALNARILCLTGDMTQCTQEERTQKETAPAVVAAPRRYDAMVKVLGFMLHGPNATNAQLDALTVHYMFFWSIGAPIIGLMLSVFLMMTRHKQNEPVAARYRPFKNWSEKTWQERAKFWEQVENPAYKPEDDGDDGLIHESYTQEEWEWLQKAKDHRANYERGQEMKDKLKIGNKEWLKAQKMDIVSLFETGFSPLEIAESRGLSLPEFEEWVRKFFKESMADKILRTGEQHVNGADMEGDDDVNNGTPTIAT